MSAGAWIALASLALTFVLTIIGGAFKLGAHSQRIAALEEKTRNIGSLEVLAAGLLEMKEQLVEIRHDVKNLLTGRIKPARRDPEA